MPPPRSLAGGPLAPAPLSVGGYAAPNKGMRDGAGGTVDAVRTDDCRRGAPLWLRHLRTNPPELLPHMRTHTCGSDALRACVRARSEQTKFLHWRASPPRPQWLKPELAACALRARDASADAPVAAPPRRQRRGVRGGAGCRRSGQRPAFLSPSLAPGSGKVARFDDI